MCARQKTYHTFKSKEKTDTVDRLEQKKASGKQLNIRQTALRGNRYILLRKKNPMWHSSLVQKQCTLDRF